MGKVLGLASTIITTNKLAYVISAILLGSLIMILSISVPSISSIYWIIEKGGVWSAFIETLKDALASPIAFTYVLIATAALDALSSKRRGSSIITLLPVNRSDIIKATYLITLVTAITATLVGTYVSSIYAYFTSGLKISSDYPVIIFSIYLVALVPTMIFITSLGMLIYSLTPIRSNIPWILAVVYLIGIPIIMGILGGVVRSEYLSKLILSILIPSYGLLNYMQHLMIGNAFIDVNTLTYFIASITSVSVITPLAIVVFNTYAEVSL